MKLSNKEQFSSIFNRHYKRLFNYAVKLTNDSAVSKELVQETYIKLWEKVDFVNVNDRTIESFLIVTLKNKIVDYYRSVRTREKHTKSYSRNTCLEIEMDKDWELIKEIDLIYQSLPLKTAEIFRLSRDKGLTYNEISIKNKISVKTVEAHISKALVVFKKGLKNYL